MTPDPDRYNPAAPYRDKVRARRHKKDGEVLEAALGRLGIKVIGHQCTAWNTATFTGAKHTFHVSGAVDAKALETIEIDDTRFILADIVIVPDRYTIEALVVDND